MKRVSSAAACLVAGALLAGCVVEATNPYPAPPPPQVETVPPPPQPNGVVVWQPGHQHWNGSAYVWIPGRYVTRSAGMNRWEPGHWADRGGAWVWVPGHWV